MAVISMVMRVLTHLNVGATLALIAWVASAGLPVDAPASPAGGVVTNEVSAQADAGGVGR